MLCPEDTSSATLPDPGAAPAGQPAGIPCGRNNYFGSIGGTADQRSSNAALAGIFNFGKSMDFTSTLPGPM